MMTFEEYKDKAIDTIREAIKNEPYGDKDAYIEMCIPYLQKKYETAKAEAEFFGWKDLNVSGLGYGAHMSYPGLEFLGGPSEDEMQE